MFLLLLICSYCVQASISRESSLFCMLSLSDEIPTVVIGALNLTSRYPDDLLYIDTN